MNNAVRQIFHVRASMSCNRLLYWLGRVPLIKRGIRPALYADLSLKHTLTGVVTALQLLGALAGKFLYLGLCLLLPGCLVLGEGFFARGWPLFVQMLFALSFFGGCFLSSELLAATLLEYTCVRQMGMKARTFLFARLAQTHGLAFVSFTPALTAFAALLGAGPLAGLLLSVELAGVRLLAEALQVGLYDKTGRVLHRSFWYVMVIALLTLAGAYAPLPLEVALPFHRVLLHPAAGLLLALLGAAALAWLLKYPRYRPLVNQICTAENVSTAAAKQKAAQAAFRDVQLKDSDFQAGPAPARIGRLRGYDYLNALFFHRHRRLLVRPVQIELAIVGLLLLAGAAGCLLARETMARTLEQIGLLLPASVFLMYLAGNTLGQRICKAMFYNCDLSLLRYGWYRQPGVVLRNFAVRLRRVARLNLLVAGAVCLTVLLLTALSGARPAPGDLIPFLLCILLLAVLFSIHPLFMYYIFQPYTAQLAVKNPFFGIINWVMYFVCYCSIQIKQPPRGFALLVLGVTLLYIAAALLLVWRRAPKTFRVK